MHGYPMCCNDGDAGRLHRRAMTEMQTALRLCLYSFENWAYIIGCLWFGLILGTGDFGSSACPKCLTTKLRSFWRQHRILLMYKVRRIL